MSKRGANSSLKSNSPTVASGHQPGGLADSSRWLKQAKTTGTNRKRVAPRRDARISKRISCIPLSSGTPSGCDHSSFLNRWSSLRYDHRLLSRNPPGCKSCLVFLLSLPLCRRRRRLGQINSGVEDFRLFCLLVFSHDDGKPFLLSTVLALKKADCAFAFLIFSVAEASLLIGC